MSNFDKAVEIIGELATEYGQPGGDELFGLDEDAALALKENGLLAPDLPEPYRPGIFKVASPYFDVRSVQAAEDQIVLHGYKKRHSSISEARRLALALLAACEYAEKEKGNE